MMDGCEERDSMERGVEAKSQKAGRVRLGGRGRAVIKNVGESSLESSSVISPSLPLPFARSLPPSLPPRNFSCLVEPELPREIETPMHTFEHVERLSFQLFSCTQQTLLLATLC